ncbi:primosomal protein DnaI [Paenibacillus macerans]|uniref:primosomal protein DnaI n=1 Tax=Paenibacillus macerans TaxID=44252 RepID=UPI003D322423
MGEELKKLVPTNFAERQAEIMERMARHEEVKRIAKEYPDQSSDLLHPRNYRDLSQHLSYFDHCKSCPGLDACQNDQKGHTSVVEPDLDRSDALNFRLQKCPLLIGYEKQQRIGRLIKSHHIPKSILNATFEDIEPDPPRRAAIMEAMQFCSEFVPGETAKGLYLYGQMGVGKSRIVGAIAQELAKRGIDVLMVYVPDFLAEVKDSIGSNGVLSKLDALKEASVLILDDIGAEPLTSWTRDEVLGPILQRRMEEFATIYTSNLTISELRKHLANVKDAKDTDRKQHEKKAERIIERIEPFVKVLPVGGRNRRRE